jgi:hypothetical protein
MSILERFKKFNINSKINKNASLNHSIRVNLLPIFTKFLILPQNSKYLKDLGK